MVLHPFSAIDLLVTWCTEFKAQKGMKPWGCPQGVVPNHSFSFLPFDCPRHTVHKPTGPPLPFPPQGPSWLLTTGKYYRKGLEHGLKQVAGLPLTIFRHWACLLNLVNRSSASVGPSVARGKYCGLQRSECIRPLSPRPGAEGTGLPCPSAFLHQHHP